MGCVFYRSPYLTGKPERGRPSVMNIGKMTSQAQQQHRASIYVLPPLTQLRELREAENCGKRLA
jgi:hypothetical protein